MQPAKIMVKVEGELPRKSESARTKQQPNNVLICWSEPLLPDSFIPEVVFIILPHGRRPTSCDFDPG
jgi:hypothetical protein